MISPSKLQVKFETNWNYNNIKSQIWSLYIMNKHYYSISQSVGLLIDNIKDCDTINMVIIQSVSHTMWIDQVLITGTIKV